MSIYYVCAWFSGTAETPLELKLQVLGSTMRVLGIEPRSSARAANAPNHEDVSPACSLFIPSSHTGLLILLRVSASGPSSLLFPPSEVHCPLISVWLQPSFL